MHAILGPAARGEMKQTTFDADADNKPLTSISLALGLTFFQAQKWKGMTYWPE